MDEETTTGPFLLDHSLSATALVSPDFYLPLSTDIPTSFDQATLLPYSGVVTENALSYRPAPTTSLAFGSPGLQPCFQPAIHEGDFSTTWLDSVLDDTVPVPVTEELPQASCWLDQQSVSQFHSLPIEINSWPGTHPPPWSDQLLPSSISTSTSTSTVSVGKRPSPPRNREAVRSNSSSVKSHEQSKTSSSSSSSRRRSSPQTQHKLVKSRGVRQIGACWRCRKYKKPCDQNGGICASCVVSGFRIWPSELGCRRERLESLTFDFIPEVFEASLMHLPPAAAKKPSWRQLNAALLAPTDFTYLSNANDSPWTKVKVLIKQIRIFGVDFDELADIIECYEKSRSTRCPCLEVCRSLLVAVCQLYPCFVTGGKDDELIPPSETIIPIVSSIRRLLSRSFALTEKLCLSSKRTDWFPATLSASLITCAGIVFIDTMIVVPSPVREMIWGDTQARRAWMRSGSYHMLIDLLRASTKGVNPLRLPCFEGPVQQHLSSQGSENASESAPESVPESATTASATTYKDALLGEIDPHSFSGMKKLKIWTKKNQGLMAQAMEMFRLDLYNLDKLRPIGSLCKIYEW